MSNRYAGVLTVVMACAGLVTASGTRPLDRQSDLDAFMAKVLESRDQNWKKLQQYVLDERERVELRGLSNQPIWGEQNEYTWFIREGYFVRSPTKVNGVAIGEADRRKAEDDYLGRAKTREKRAERARAAGAAEVAPPAAAPPAPDPAPQDLDALLRQTRQPQFIDSAYFLNFKFEPGTYALVGRDTFDGREVLRIEHYPKKLFSHEQDTQRKRQAENKPNRREDAEATLERMMNKVSLVTLWVEPASHQIVKYTFDNVNLDFLPVAWLARLTDLKASMTMSEPFPGVWLPRGVDMYFAGMLAVGSFSLRYTLDYENYRQATTSGRIIRIGGGE